MLIKNGTILNKWSDEDIPDEYVLTDKLENLNSVSRRSGGRTYDWICFLVVCHSAVAGVGSGHSDCPPTRTEERKRKQQQEVKE